MRTTCEQYQLIAKENGCMKQIKTYSYVALLCKVDGDEVKAVRYDGYTSKYDLPKVVKSEYPEYKCKGILKLYDLDFEQEVW